MRRFCFFHIPKSAGTSFAAGLRSIFSVSPPFPAGARMDESTASAISVYTVAGGHLSCDDYVRWFSDRAAFTILRDPIERCLSWYWYCRNVVPDHVTAPDVRSAKYLPPEEYFYQDRDVIFRVMNAQARQIGGHYFFPEPCDAAVLVRARGMLDRMIWIGLAETLECDAGRLRKIPEFSALPAIGRTNTSVRDFGVPAAVRDRIEEINGRDIELYEHAKNLIAQSGG